MSRYIALLRGINVGGRQIAMSELTDAFQSLGMKEMRTFIQSGNVVFESGLSVAKARNVIETGLSQSFNYPAKVFVYPLSRVSEIIDHYPFADKPDHHNYVIFLDGDLATELAQEAGSPTDQDSEQIKAGNGVVYWQVQKGLTLKSPFAKYLGKSKYRTSNTNRNLNTLRKLVDLTKK